MELTPGFVFKKEVDWSLLYQGIAIPIEAMNYIFIGLPFMKEHGVKSTATIILEGITYVVKLTNSGFNESKWGTHKEQLRFLYTPKHSFAMTLQSIFHNSLNYIEENKKKNKHSNIPKELKEYLVFYPTDKPDTFVADCWTKDDIAAEHSRVNNQDELLIEVEMDIFKEDPTSGMSVKTGIIKQRHYNQTIGDSLKKYYEHKCQICGHEFKGRYDIDLSEIHHIEYYSTSLNNDSDNLLVLCPNHHRIIHKANPKFERKGLLYKFKNGLEEKLEIKGHLV